MLIDAGWFVLGLVLAGLSIWPLLRLSAGMQRKLAALYLVLAGLIYVGFGVVWGDGPWIAIELGGTAVCALFAVLGLRGSLLWIAAGWGLHPLWDLALHLLGPGAHIVPRWYAIACLSFDLLMASWLVTLARRADR